MPGSVIDPVAEQMPVDAPEPSGDEPLATPRKPYDAASSPRQRHRRGWVVRRKLIAADLLGLAGAFLLLQVLLGSSSNNSGRVTLDGELLVFACLLPVWLVLAQAMGLYNRDEERPEHTTVDDLVGVFMLVTMGVWLNFVAAYATGLTTPDLEKWIYFWALAIAFVAFARSGARFIARRSSEYIQNAVIVGTDRTGQIIARKLMQHPEFRINVVGFVDGTPRTLRPDVEHLPVVGDATEIFELIDRYDLDRVVFAFSGPTEREMMQLARRLPALGVQVDIVPRFFEALGPNTSLTSLEGVQLVSMPPTHLSRGALLLKRVFDVVVASILLLFLWPVLLVIALWVKRDSPGPVLFTQTRLGLDQRPFRAFKFRTMRADTSQDEHRDYIRRAMDTEASSEDNGVFKLERGDVVTRSGRWLRKTSLDELPQLFNVLRGDMSLVGPRPCIPYETEHFRPHHFERFSVPAGITGLWQVKARARSPFIEALEMDVLYARSWSFGRDVMLLLQTPVQVFRPKATR